MQVLCISEFSPPPQRAFILLLKALPNLGAISGEQLAKESVPKILPLPGSRLRQQALGEEKKTKGKEKKRNTWWSPMASDIPGEHEQGFTSQAGL